MNVTDVARFIIVVQYFILGLYSAVSEKPMLFSFGWNSKEINICKNEQWQQFHVNQYVIPFLTADMKHRILYWITRNGFFSMAVDGNKTVVNLSKKFKEGLVYQGFLQRAIALNRLGSIQFTVHDDQLIFAENNWGLMKFDVKSNKKLFSLNGANIKQFVPASIGLGIDTCGNETCLYWTGPSDNQISRYIIESNQNQKIVQRPKNAWIPLSVQKDMVFWNDINDDYFITNMKLQNKRTWISEDSAASIQFVLFDGIMYYLYKRNMSSKFLKTIYPLRPYYSPCSRKSVGDIMVVIPAPGVFTDHDDGDVVVEDGVKTSIWSTVGWSLGIVFILLILVILCISICKMMRRNPDNSHHNYATTGNAYNVPENIYTTHDTIYRDSSVKFNSETGYIDVRI